MAHLSIRIPDADLAYLKAEAARQDRDVSYVLRGLIQAQQTPTVSVEPTQVLRAGAIAYRHGLKTTQVIKLCLDFALDVFETRPILGTIPGPKLDRPADGLKLNLAAPEPDEPTPGDKDPNS